MGETNKHVCNHCGGNSVWRNFLDGIKRVFKAKRQEDRLMYIPVETVDQNPYQPREYVMENPLESLRKSVEQYGVIVPIIVNRHGSRFTLVAGQRRLQAARELGFKFIPAIVRSLNLRQMMEVSYLENLHREELSKVDVVEMFDLLSEAYEEAAIYGKTPVREALSKAAGEARSILNAR